MFQAVIRGRNKLSYALGAITPKEAELADSDEIQITTQGLYLVEVDNDNPKAAGRVMAKFVSEEAAHDFAKMFRIHGLLET